MEKRRDGRNVGYFLAIQSARRNSIISLYHYLHDSYTEFKFVFVELVARLVIRNE